MWQINPPWRCQRGFTPKSASHERFLNSGVQIQAALRKSPSFCGNIFALAPFLAPFMKHANDTRISIGTSGWTYDGWRGSLYPEALRKSDWLPFYASRFRTVEINGSFYRTPSLEVVQAWHDHTPKNFHFAWKASKFITHWKRLSDKCENSIALMDSRLRALEQKISVVLFQLPPNFLEDAERLASFLTMLPRCYRYAFEFRHGSWYVDRVLTILQEANVALCFSDHADAPAPWETTAGHIYVRAHGPSGRYHGTYPARTLRRWADAALRWQSEKRKVYIYFDNDQKAAAPKDAARLAAIVGGASKSSR
jgi:uncharacterized protein YecE (DUF72 family)